MVKTQIKTQNTIKNKKDYGNRDYAIKLTPQLADGLRWISSKTGMTQLAVLEKILLPHIQTAISYENFSFITYPDRNNIVSEFTGFHGSRLISGSSGSGGFGSEADLLEFIAETAGKQTAKAQVKA